MKQYLIILWLFLLAHISFGQQTKPIIFGDSLCLSTSAPVLLQKGVQVHITCDSAYLINTVRYGMYLQLHRYIREDATQQCLLLIDAYEKALADSHLAYQDMKQQYQHCDTLSSQWIAQSQQALKDIQQTVQHTDSMVSQSENNLEAAKKSLRAERRRHFMHKIIAGATGIVLGLAVAHF